MIKKYESSWEYDCSSTPEAWTHNCYMLVNFVEGLKLKINELVDMVNTLVEENNIHEKQIDELQMKLEPEKCEPSDPYAEQRKWIGKLCKFEGENYGILKEIGCSDTKHVCRDGAFRSSDGYWYDFCAPVKPDDDIIYKGEQQLVNLNVRSAKKNYLMHRK